MKHLLAVLSLAVPTGIALLVPTYGASAVAVCVAAAAVAVAVIYRVREERGFLLPVFVGALLARMLVGTFIFGMNLQDFFGGDALTYDELGSEILQSWRGEPYNQEYIDAFSAGGGWGMIYLVGAVYSVAGRNMLAVQFVNSVLGAATASIIFLCARHIFQNRRVAMLSALFVGFYPSLVLWSCQGLKDGPIVFFLALSMYTTLKLGDKVSIGYLIALASAMLAILTLRFYIFYMLVACVVGAFVIGMRAVTSQSFLRQFVVIGGIGLALTYVGVPNVARTQVETYADLNRIQTTRSDLAQSADSGFGRDLDVSTASGALMALPVGAVNLLFAPFPWQLANLRQGITLPEMLVWWVSIPLLVIGLWFTVKYRMRQAMPILLFTTMITIAYSLFQGNVGTAYRQRAQILVFHFIFVSVGYVLLKEQQEDGKRLQSAARQALVEEASAKQEQRHSIRMARQTSEREPARVARGVNERLDT